MVAEGDLVCARWFNWDLQGALEQPGAPPGAAV
jgi:hypothetical protein